MATLTNYSPAVDLAYAQYHAELLKSVAARDRLTQLSRTIANFGESVPDAGHVDYSAITTLLNNVEKLMYPAADDWDAKILFCLFRFNAQRVPSLTYAEIVSYISDAERLANNSINQGMVGAIQVTLDGMVQRQEIEYENGRYSR